MAGEQKQRIVFMGTPDFAATILARLLAWPGGEIAGVFTQPDKKSGRGMRLMPSAVKTLALEHDLPIFQPSSLRRAEDHELLKNLRPDFLAVASYGLILPQDVLDMPAIAPVNVHASLLPAYRGAAPIQRAIMENFKADAKTGVSIMKMTAALDAGPVYLQRPVPIGGMTAAELSAELAMTGAGALVETLDKLSAGQIEAVPQDESGATYARKLTKEDGLIDWNKPAGEIEALIRAVTPWPGAQTVFELQGNDVRMPVTLLGAKPGELCRNAQAGQIRREKDTLAVACGDKWLYLEALRPQGRKLMRAQDFANGYSKIKSGLCGQALSENR